VTARLRPEVKIPLVTTNRINTPEVAEAALARGDADLVSMARPLLADPHFVAKAARNEAHRINTCIACNQACLDHTFKNQVASCLVNPRACFETELNFPPAQDVKKVAVVGAGPAGLACATLAAERGHQVTLFDQADDIGGQFNMARKVPGKEEFNETIRYFRQRIEETGVTLQLGQRAEVGTLAGFDELVIATGVTPRIPAIEGIDHPSVLTYLEVLRDGAPVGQRVAIVGAGGIGFDIADYLAHDHDQPSPSLSMEAFARDWGIDLTLQARGGVAGVEPEPVQAARQLTLLQRKDSKPGKGLGKTTGWVHRMNLKRRGIEALSGVNYRKIDDEGLHIEQNGEERVLPVDNVVICAGQLSNQELFQALQAAGREAHLLGGAFEARELDAKHAIRQGAELAARL
jgi:2,4-dienoyl-CoA reductase (NADPH2)